MTCFSAQHCLEHYCHVSVHNFNYTEWNNIHTHALDRLDCASVIKLFSRDYTIILGIKEHSYVNVQNMCYFDYIWGYNTVLYKTIIIQSWEWYILFPLPSKACSLSSPLCSSYLGPKYNELHFHHLYHSKITLPQGGHKPPYSSQTRINGKGSVMKGNLKALPNQTSRIRFPYQLESGLTTTASSAVGQHGAGGNCAIVGQRQRKRRGGRHAQRQCERRKGRVWKWERL